MQDRSDVKYVKHNRVRLKVGRREESTKLVLAFFIRLEGKVKGIKGFVIMNGIRDEQESVVLTFWETKQDMDDFYRPDNNVLADFVEKSKPLFEQMPERNDYAVAKFRI